MNWSKKIETGLPAIDIQHKRIFELARTLADLGSPVRVMAALAELSNYMNAHFQEEEAMLAAAGYPAVDAHAAQHEEFRQMMVQMLEEARHLTLDQIAERGRLLVDDLLHRHIQQSDLHYIPFVKSNARA